MVALSPRTNKAVDIAARGPLVKAIMANWGTYVTENMTVVTPSPIPMVLPAREMNGPQRSLWVAIYITPWHNRH